MADEGDKRKKFPFPCGEFSLDRSVHKQSVHNKIICCPKAIPDIIKYRAMHG
jgi:hypothetical protein